MAYGEVGEVSRKMVTSNKTERLRAIGSVTVQTNQAILKWD